MEYTKYYRDYKFLADFIIYKTNEILQPILER